MITLLFKQREFLMAHLEPMTELLEEAGIVSKEQVLERIKRISTGRD